MTSKKQHKVADILIKGGFNTWEAVRMVTQYYDEVTSLYADVTAPSKIAKLVTLAASV